MVGVSGVAGGVLFSMVGASGVAGGVMCGLSMMPDAMCGCLWDVWGLLSLCLAVPDVTIQYGRIPFSPAMPLSGIRPFMFCFLQLAFVSL